MLSVRFDITQSLFLLTVSFFIAVLVAMWVNCGVPVSVVCATGQPVLCIQVRRASAASVNRCACDNYNVARVHMCLCGVRWRHSCKATCIKSCTAFGPALANALAVLGIGAECQHKSSGLWAASTRWASVLGVQLCLRTVNLPSCSALAHLCVYQLFWV